jgi:hypothetical protein
MKLGQAGVAVVASGCATFSAVIMGILSGLIMGPLRGPVVTGEPEKHRSQTAQALAGGSTCQAITRETRCLHCQLKSARHSIKNQRHAVQTTRRGLTMAPILDFPDLLACAEKSATITTPCNCIAMPLPGWESWPPTLREEHLQKLGTLAQVPEDEATLDEYHPDGTTFWSPNALIAARYYPYNQSELWACGNCGRAYLRFDDHGAYHCERRIRSLDAGLLVDAPWPAVAATGPVVLAD